MKTKKIVTLLLCTVLSLQATVPLYASTSETSETFSASTGITHAAEVVGLSVEERIDIIGKLCQQDYASSGILASVSAAQCILESGYMGTSLAREANNCFGMKTTLSGNTWANSSWDGITTYSKKTWEEYNGKIVTITADFRKYDSVADSIADHSAYLLGAKDGNQLRYAGLKGEKDYKKAIEIIKNGGYATDSQYVTKICNIIERFNLTQYDRAISTSANKNIKFYRVRKTWDDAASQIGAFLNLTNAKNACLKGYTVFDWNGTVIYSNH